MLSGGDIGLGFMLSGGGGLIVGGDIGLGFMLSGGDGLIVGGDNSVGLGLMLSGGIVGLTVGGGKIDGLMFGGGDGIVGLTVGIGDILNGFGGRCRRGRGGRRGRRGIGSTGINGKDELPSVTIPIGQHSQKSSNTAYVHSSFSHKSTSLSPHGPTISKHSGSSIVTPLICMTRSPFACSNGL